MILSLLGDAEWLPETFHFLQVGWWVFHVIAVLVVFMIGLLAGRKCTAKPDHPQASQEQ